MTAAPILHAQSGYALARDCSASDAGHEAVRLAIEGLGVPPQVVLIFASVLLNQEHVLDGARRATLRAGGTALIVGASSAAELTEFGVLEQGVTALALSSPDLLFGVGSASLEEVVPVEAGRRAVAQALEKLAIAGGVRKPPAPAFAIAFPDLSHANPMHLIAGMQQAAGCDLPVFAVGAAGSSCVRAVDDRPVHAMQYVDGYPRENRIVSLVAAIRPDSPLRIAYSTKLGWTPIGPAVKVDGAEGCEVTSIGGQRVFDFYSKYLGEDIRHQQNLSPFALALEPTDGKPTWPELVMPMALDLPSGSIRFFPPVDLLGRRVRITRPSREHLLSAASAAGEEALGRLGGARPVAALVFGSFLRRRIMRTRGDRELDAVRNALGPDVSIAGAFGIGEIAPLLRRVAPTGEGVYEAATETQALELPAIPAVPNAAELQSVTLPHTGSLTVLVFGDSELPIPDVEERNGASVSARIARMNAFRITSSMTPQAIMDRQQREIEYLRARLREAEDHIEETEKVLFKTNEDLLNANRRLEDHRDQLERLSRTDTLTELSNRRQLFRLLDRAFGEYARYRTRFTVALMDIDHFKQINDTHGHLIGDDVLRKVAGIIRDNIRECDHLARYGGEEFVTIYPQTDSDGAAIVSERVRSAVAREAVSVDDLDLRVTISIGVVAIDEVDTPTIDLLLAAADSVMYAAKRAGRNRVFTLRDAPLPEDLSSFVRPAERDNIPSSDSLPNVPMSRMPRNNTARRHRSDTPDML